MTPGPAATPDDPPGTAEDPFGTAELRSAVLAAWERSPARFREDANTEEDHGRGYYRDRVVVELAQNAADAAARHGQPGRLLLRLTDDGTEGATLVAANTGAALDASGVASLASLRASAKRAVGADGAEPVPRTVGRFGVGFAAVRSVSDDVVVVSAGRGVRFSLEAASAALAGPVGRSPGLRAEVEARDGSLPVLRLPVPLDPDSQDAVPAGYTTAVVLRLRDPAAAAAVRAQLAQLDDALLLALPSLDEVRVEAGDGPRTLADAPSRWLSVTRSGVVPPALLADRPVEERSAAAWSVTWAVPRDGAIREGVLHAPTPTDEPLTIPALLVASFPLDPSRRHVAPGALAELVASEAGRTLAELALVVPQPLDLVPTGLPAGRLDAEVRDAALAALRGAPILGGRVASDAVVVDGEVSDDLVDALGVTGLGVVAVPVRHRAAARLLGATTMSLADIVDTLPDGLSAPQWWRLYDALAPYADGDRAVREALGGMLVPLADGTTTRGPRGLVVAGRLVELVAPLGLRVVHPEASHPLLLRLGAMASDDPEVLALPTVEAVARDAADDLLDTDVDVDAGWPDDVAALLALVAGVAAAHGTAAGHERAWQVPAWLGGLPLPADDGSWRAADELAWPGSWSAEHLDLALVDVPDDDVWAPVALETARILGVRERLVVRTVEEHRTGQDPRLGGDDDHSPRDGTAPGHEIAGWDDYEEYLTAVLGPDRPVGDLLVVPDLEAVHDDSWGAVVDVLTQEPGLREALLTPVRSRGGPGSGAGTGGPDAVRSRPGAQPAAVSYAAWYLRDVLRAPFVAPSSALQAGGAAGSGPAAGLGAVLPEAPTELAGVTDARVLEVLGAISTAEGLESFLCVADPAGWDAFWSGLPDVGTPVATPVARAVWSALASAAAAGLELDPLPERVVALQGGVARVVEADDVVVAGQPMWAQVRAVVPVAEPELVDAVADALDAAVADASAVAVRASEDAEERSVPEQLALVLGGVRDTLPATWSIHDELTVDGKAVEWWVTTDGGVHVATSESPEASGSRGLAQAAGRWASRHTIEIVLRDAGRGADAAAENAWA
ncbi:ATP-binding protein [Sanguibacter sp. 25GB23B1]|uniref:sacsin N-terminal ATP-binding-like domain-containing protein n=1 Tax=unclassified Sanguibacter TaxID=2645534 RepID=UPI0032AEE36D